MNQSSAPSRPMQIFLACLAIPTAIPFLSVLGVALQLVPILFLGIPLTNLFKITDIPFNLGPFQITGIQQVVTAIVASIVFFALGRLLWNLFRRVLAFIGDTFQRKA